MKVFTSIFVLDSLHTTFADIDEAVRKPVEHSDLADVTDPRRLQVASLELWKEVPRSRQGGGTA